MVLRIQYASNLMLHRIPVAVSPLHPVGDVLILAGQTGPIGNMRVQNFYQWCSKHYKMTYTDMAWPTLNRILPNVYPLNYDYYYLPMGVTVGNSYHQTDIHVSDFVPSKARRFQIHSKGSFDISFEDGVRHLANDLQSKNFQPDKCFDLDYMHDLQ